jgi:leucyl/phenylalanyl-tRNA--protein transferase
MSLPHLREIRFPPAESADENGIVCLGYDLGPDVLISAYRQGIFPWPMLGEPYPIPWCSPDPRAVIEFDDFHVSRRLARTIRSGKFEVASDRAFEQVVRGCAAPRPEDDPADDDWYTPGPGEEPVPHSWITERMIEAYCLLHRLGAAHSVEVWHAGDLVGGIYGVSIGGLFAGESMFHTMRDASKVALAALVSHLQRRGFVLFDIQQYTPHTGRMGAVEISREDYLKRARSAVNLPVTFGTITAADS